MSRLKGLFTVCVPSLFVLVCSFIICSTAFSQIEFSANKKSAAPSIGMCSQGYLANLLNKFKPTKGFGEQAINITDNAVSNVSCVEPFTINRTNSGFSIEAYLYIDQQSVNLHNDIKENDPLFATAFKSIQIICNCKTMGNSISDKSLLLETGGEPRKGLKIYSINFQPCECTKSKAVQDTFHDYGDPFVAINFFYGRNDFISEINKCFESKDDNNKYRYNGVKVARHRRWDTDLGITTCVSTVTCTKPAL